MGAGRHRRGPSRLGALPGGGVVVGLSEPVGRGRGWAVHQVTGSAAVLHGRDIDWSSRSMTTCRVTGPALVLGSTQSRHDLAAPSSALEVVRRRSGGGAVLVEPGRLLWVDVVIPAGDAQWRRDVGRASWWLGEAWAEALGRLGVGGALGPPSLAVHRGASVASAWSSRVCFAGLGPGEVTVAGRKVVGISQRRTRAGVLFQSAVPLAFDAHAMADLTMLAGPERARLAGHLGATVAVVGRDESVVARELARALENR